MAAARRKASTSAERPAGRKASADVLAGRVSRNALGQTFEKGTKVADIDPPLTDDERERLERLGLIGKPAATIT